MGAQVGVDGWRLLQAMTSKAAPDWRWQIPAVQVLRQVWVQQYTPDACGREVIWRHATIHGLPPGRTMLLSPYDTDARHSQKRGRAWSGYKVHLTETCDNTDTHQGTDQGTDQDAEQPPDLIINVATTHAAVDDSSMTMPIHHALAERELLPPN